ncbi:MAG: hypothetical protein P8Y34_09570 [Anaerolineales bacterium]
MDQITLQEFNQLIQHQADPSLTFYMPAIKKGREIQQNAVRFKNLIAEAEERLESRGFGRTERESFLKPLYGLEDDRDYWQNQERGLAVFLSPETLKMYRLPLEFSEMVVLDSRFHIKPLLPLFLENERYYLLTLGKGDIHLYAGTRFDLAELDLPDTPTSLEEALKYDEPVSSLQYQEGAAGSTQQSAIFHGHEQEKDEKSNIKRFFQMVDQGVREVISGSSVPLLLAGLEYLQPIYRQVNSYQLLREEGIQTNPDQLDQESLHQKAWEILSADISESRSQAYDHYKSLENGKTTAQLVEILSAAYHARIDTLFVELEGEVWGNFDLESGSLEFLSREDPASRDLVDLALIHTLLNGGQVQILDQEELELEGNSSAAAILRY